MSLIEAYDEQLSLVTQSQFANAAIKTDWTDSRKLHNESIPYYHTERGYSEMLPTYRSLNLEQLIQLAIDQSPDRSITLVDCGSGRRGSFLRSCAEHWREYGRIMGIGITAQKTVSYEEELFLAAQGISIIEGDMHHVDQIVGEGVADIIVSNFSIPYLADPWGGVLSINRALKPGRIALANYIPFGSVVLDGGSNIEYFRSQLTSIDGMEAYITHDFLPNAFSLSWEKRFDALPIGLSYAGQITHSTLPFTRDAFEVDQVLYTMDY